MESENAKETTPKVLDIKLGNFTLDIGAVDNTLKGLHVLISYEVPDNFKEIVVFDHLPKTLEVKDAIDKYLNTEKANGRLSDFSYFGEKLKKEIGVKLKKTFDALHPEPAEIPSAIPVFSTQPVKTLVIKAPPPRISGLTKSGFEINTQGMSYLADKIKNDLKIKVIRASSRDLRTIYAWKEGYYQLGGDQDIEEAVKAELDDNYEAKWYSIVFNHIVSKGNIERWEFKPPKRTINIENGILTYPGKKVIFTPLIDENGQERDFSHMNFAYKIPLVYNPNARCPEIETIIQQILIDKSIDREHLHQLEDLTWIQKLTTDELADPDKQDEIQEHLQKYRDIKLGKDPMVEKLFTFYEFLGMCLMSEYEIKKAMIILGLNDTGKSTLSNIPRKFLGERNCVSVPLSKLDSNTNRFAASRLENKFLNVVEELPRINIKSFDTFKAATSGSVMDIERKNKDGSDMENFAKFFLCSNETPNVSPDVFESTMNRFVGIECTNVFKPNDNTTEIQMQHREFTPEQLSGLLNIAILGLERLLESGGKFTAYDPSETAGLWNKYNNAQEKNPVRDFLRNYCVVSGEREDCITRKELWIAYANANGIDLNDPKKEKENARLEATFSQNISHIKDPVVDDRGRTTGRYVNIGTKRVGADRYWTGIRMTAFTIPGSGTIKGNNQESDTNDSDSMYQ